MLFSKFNSGKEGLRGGEREVENGKGGGSHKQLRWEGVTSLLSTQQMCRVKLSDSRSLKREKAEIKSSPSCFHPAGSTLFCSLWMPAAWDGPFPHLPNSPWHCLEDFHDLQHHAESSSWFTMIYSGTAGETVSSECMIQHSIASSKGKQGDLHQGRWAVFFWQSVDAEVETESVWWHLCLWCVLWSNLEPWLCFCRCQREREVCKPQSNALRAPAAKTYPLCWTGITLSLLFLLWKKVVCVEIKRTIPESLLLIVDSLPTYNTKWPGSLSLCLEHA